MTLAGQVVSQALQFPTNLILARLLTPEHFGLVGQVAVFTGIAYFLADLGLGTAIVQRPDLDEGQLSSVFWINMGVGISLALFFAALAPFVAEFYQNPALGPLTAVIGTTFIFSSLKVTQYNLLRRRMEFGKLAWVDASAQLGGSVVAIGMALTGFGVWALVALRIVRAALPNLVLAVVCPFRPKLEFQFARVKDMMKFGGYLLGTTTSVYASRNLDKLLVGRMFGEGPLGLYLRAYDFMLLPIEQITPVVGRVMVPSMARQQTDRAAVGGLLLTGLAKVAYFSAPIMGSIAVTSEQLTLALFGKQWLESAPILQTFAGLGFLHSLLAGNQWVHVGLGKVRQLFAMQLISTAVLLAGALLGAQLGLLGVARGLLIAQLLLFFPIYRVTLKITGVRWSAWWGTVAPICACASLALVPTWWLSRFISDWPAWGQLIALDSCCAVVYALVTWAMGLGPLTHKSPRLLDGLIGE